MAVDEADLFVVDQGWNESEGAKGGIVDIQEGSSRNLEGFWFLLPPTVFIPFSQCTRLNDHPSSQDVCDIGMNQPGYRTVP